MEVKRAILNDLYRNGSAIRQEIMRRLRMRLNNIVAACDALLESCDLRKEDSTRQRNVHLELVPSRFLTIGAEHRPDRFVMLLMDPNRREVERRECALSPECGGKERLERILAKLSAFYDECSGNGCRIVSLGLADVGILDHKSGRTVFSAHVREWDGLELRAALKERFRCHVELLSRADAGCFADSFNGGRSAIDNLIYIIVRGGIGASLVLHGNFLREYLPAAGEMHVRVRHGGPVCSCGKAGCLETVSSAGGILARYARLSPKKKTLPAGLRDFFRLVSCGDELAGKLLAEGGEALGRVAADISGFSGISRIVLRSEVNDESGIYASAFKRALTDEMLAPLRQSLVLSIGGIDESDAPVGAALYALDKYFSSPEVQ